MNGIAATYYRVEGRRDTATAWTGMYRNFGLLNAADYDLLSEKSNEYKPSMKLGYKPSLPAKKVEHWFTPKGWHLVREVMEHLAETYPDHIRIRREQLTDFVWTHELQVVKEY